MIFLPQFFTLVPPTQMVTTFPRASTFHLYITNLIYVRMKQKGLGTNTTNPWQSHTPSGRAVRKQAAQRAPEPVGKLQPQTTPGPLTFLEINSYWSTAAYGPLVPQSHSQPRPAKPAIWPLTGVYGHLIHRDEASRLPDLTSSYWEVN